MPDKLAIIEQRATRNEPYSYPLISVIVPVYKVEAFLNRCVASILAQTYTNLEVIIIDDGSPDNCPAMCDEWARKDSRVKVIHTHNNGVGAARNAGLDAAQGELIGFVDSDDYLYHNMYQRLYELMIENNADISMCEYTSVNEAGNNIPDMSRKLKAGIMTRDDALRFAVLPVKDYSWHCVLPWNKLYKAQIFDAVRFPEIRKPSGGEDTAIVHRVFGASTRIIITDEELYYYVKRERVVPKFDRSLFRLSVFIVKDRYDYFTEKGMNDFAEMIAVNAYGLLVNTMRVVNYMQFRDEMADFMRDTMKILILSGRINFELRAVKLSLVWLRSIFKPFINKEEIA